MSDVLYGKRKSVPTSTITKKDISNFDLGLNSQAEPKVEREQSETDKKLLQVNVANVKINAPVINIETPQINVNLVINVCAQDLVCNARGNLELPVINIDLTININ